MSFDQRETTVFRNADPSLLFPEFIAHPLLRSAHAQTIAGTIPLGNGSPAARAQKIHRVAVSNDDFVCLHEDIPPRWREGGPAALLVHGLCGDHESSYMVRISKRLRVRGFRTFRMDLRGAGASFLLSKKLYHSGQSDDIAASVRAIQQMCPKSEVSVIGFSLGGNLVLKFLAENAVAGIHKIRNIEKAVAVSPPADLAASLARLEGAWGNLYNRYFVRLLIKLTNSHQKYVKGAATGLFERAPKTLIEFDDKYTAPINGFLSAHDYYSRSSAAPMLPQIETPTLVLLSRDDPVVCSAVFEKPVSPFVKTILTKAGGHLGFFAKSNTDPDRRWMDWRIVDWIAPIHHTLTTHRASHPHNHSGAQDAAEGI
ncbi:MAG: YheT family hydrolase [Planctomycetota bacterium]